MAKHQYCKVEERLSSAVCWERGDVTAGERARALTVQGLVGCHIRCHPHHSDEQVWLGSEVSAANEKCEAGADKEQRLFDIARSPLHQICICTWLDAGRLNCLQDIDFPLKDTSPFGEGVSAGQGIGVESGRGSPPRSPTHEWAMLELLTSTRRTLAGRGRIGWPTAPSAVTDGPQCR